MIRTCLSIFALSWFLTVASGPARADETSATQRVWDHHIVAWKSRDVEAILSDYTEESAIIVVNKVIRGRKAIGDLFRQLFDIFDKVDKPDDHQIDPATVVGKVVYITWRVKIGGVDYPFGTDTFVIDKGKIEYQTITSDPRLFAVSGSKR